MGRGFFFWGGQCPLCHLSIPLIARSLATVSSLWFHSIFVSNTIGEKTMTLMKLCCDWSKKNKDSDEAVISNLNAFGVLFVERPDVKRVRCVHLSPRRHQRRGILEQIYLLPVDTCEVRVLLDLQSPREKIIRPS